VPPDLTHSVGDDHRVLPFRRRGVGTPRQRPLPTPAEPSGAADLAKYEGGAEDSYRHRMLVNLAGLAFTVMLGTAGAWLAVSIAELRKTQDCYLSGRRNCTPINVQLLQSH
jgi:hypothetical protein